MATWSGAIIDNHSAGNFAASAKRHRLKVNGPEAQRMLIDCDARLGALSPPGFAKAISQELKCTVIAFFVQTSAGVEQVEHWESGRLQRKLVYSLDRGGWIMQKGTRQPWESVYFFSDDDAFSNHRNWPPNLDDEIAEEALERYRQAKQSKDASTIMDLLSGGSVWSVKRLCKYFDVDPRRPEAVYSPRSGWKWRAFLAATIVFLIGALVFGVLTRG